MAYLRKNYYYHGDIPPDEQALYMGFRMIEEHPLLSKLRGNVYPKGTHISMKHSISCVTRSGNIYTKISAGLSASKWAFALAHDLLHLAFGHFDKDKMPETGEFHPAVWNKACDIYVTRFLYDIGFGKPLFPDPASEYTIKLNDERKIYEYLLEHEGTEPEQTYGLNDEKSLDMIGVDAPIVYKTGGKNEYVEAFSYAITHSIKKAVSEVSGKDISKDKDTPVYKAARWFLAHYPLLGGLAASFRIIDDVEICHKYDIQIAAVDCREGEIYANPSCGFTIEEWKFVLAHEYLHAGLCHHERCQGRDTYLWNVACDYVVNDWLHEMRIGEMPSEGLLYDEELHGMSAEAIYDMIVKEIRKFKKLATFRGYGQGDIFGNNGPHFEGMGKGIGLDEFFKSSLREGLDYHITHNRGYIPAGLIEEIRALSMPPIPWEVQLGKWFDEQFPSVEKHRTYARPCRRQGATPDIPRPSYVIKDLDLESRTFGVVIDTSGSMCSSQIGLALGAIASYAMSKDVPFVRIIFCDAEATDAGYMAPEDIAGKVEVTGRGGTVLQPGVNALEKARDFPVNGPILLITDGYIENDLKIKREHAFLIPYGNKLPFRAKGKVFYMKNYEERQ